MFLVSWLEAQSLNPQKLFKTVSDHRSHNLLAFRARKGKFHARNEISRSVHMVMRALRVMERALLMTNCKKADTLLVMGRGRRVSDQRRLVNQTVSKVRLRGRTVMVLAWLVFEFSIIILGKRTMRLTGDPVGQQSD